jgi:hypothetical protein
MGLVYTYLIKSRGYKLSRNTTNYQNYQSVLMLLKASNDV